MRNLAIAAYLLIVALTIVTATSANMLRSVWVVFYIAGLMVLALVIAWACEIGLNRNVPIYIAVAWSALFIVPNVQAWGQAGLPWLWRVKFEHNNGPALFDLIGFAILSLNLSRELWLWFPLWAWVTWFSSSRSGVVGLVGGGLMLWAVGQKSRKAFIAISAVAAVGLVAALFSARGILNLSTRDQFWQTAWQMFSAHPLVGNGPNTYALVYTARYPTEPTYNHAHSLPLNTLAESGLLGFGSTTLFVVVLAGYLWQRRANPYARAALAAGASFLAHSLTDTPGTSIAVAVPLALIIGAALHD